MYCKYVSYIEVFSVQVLVLMDVSPGKTLRVLFHQSLHL